MSDKSASFYITLSTFERYTIWSVLALYVLTFNSVFSFTHLYLNFLEIPVIFSAMPILFMKSCCFDLPSRFPRQFNIHEDLLHLCYPLQALRLIPFFFVNKLQGLYPGYIIFFVQSALMIAGSRGILTRIAPPLLNFLLCGLLFRLFILKQNWELSDLFSLSLSLSEQSYTDGNKPYLQIWL